MQADLNVYICVWCSVTKKKNPPKNKNKNKNKTNKQTKKKTHTKKKHDNFHNHALRLWGLKATAKLSQDTASLASLASWLRRPHRKRKIHGSIL